MARLVSVQPRPQPNGDEVVLLADVQRELEGGPDAAVRPEALILRTLPNHRAKRTRHYSGTNPTYLEPALAEYLAEQHIEHLLLDLPSVDREEDGGQLLAHHAFWQYPPRHPAGGHHHRAHLRARRRGRRPLPAQPPDHQPGARRQPQQAGAVRVGG